MKRFGLLLAAFIGMTGCGGGGTTDDVALPYAGNWTGTWNDAARRDGGAIIITVALDGTMTGSISRTSDGLSGTVTGLVRRSGSFAATADFTGTTDFNINGALVRIDDTMTSAFEYTYLGSNWNATATLTK